MYGSMSKELGLVASKYSSRVIHLTWSRRRSELRISLTCSQTYCRASPESNASCGTRVNNLSHQGILRLFLHQIDEQEDESVFLLADNTTTDTSASRTLQRVYTQKESVFILLYSMPLSWSFRTMSCNRIFSACSARSNSLPRISNNA